MMTPFQVSILLWVVTVTVVVLWKVFGCKHFWELVDKTEFESRLETVMKTCGKFPYLYSHEVPDAAYKRVVLAMRCNKCGHAKIFKIDSR